MNDPAYQTFSVKYMFTVLYLHVANIVTFGLLQTNSTLDLLQIALIFNIDQTLVNSFIDEVLFPANEYFCQEDVKPCQNETDNRIGVDYEVYIEVAQLWVLQRSIAGVVGIVVTWLQRLDEVLACGEGGYDQQAVDEEEDKKVVGSGEKNHDDHGEEDEDADPQEEDEADSEGRVYFGGGVDELEEEVDVEEEQDVDGYCDGYFLIHCK